MMQKQSKDYSYRIYATRPALLYSNYATYCLSTYQKAKLLWPGMGTEAQEASLSYPAVFRSDGPKYKIKFQLVLQLNI